MNRNTAVASRHGGTSAEHGACRLRCSQHSIAILIPLLLAACPEPTQFHGDPKFPNGATGCRMQCDKEGLQMVGFVFSGEYSTSCVCGPLQTSPPSSADGAPAAGVIVQVQAAAAAAAANQQHMQQQQRQQRR